MENDILKRVRGWIKGQVKFYICFCKVTLFVTAAVYCLNVVNYNVASVLVTYFTATLNKDTIRRSALLVNVREWLQIVVRAWGYSRRSNFRKIIIFSTASFILSLMMLYLSASNRIPNTNFGLYMSLTVPIAVGKFGGVPFLKTFLLDELIAGSENIQNFDCNRARWLINIWLSPTGLLLMFFPSLMFWPRMFLNSMYMIGAAGFFSLWAGYLSHQRHASTKTESTKRHLKCPDTSDANCLKKDQETLPPDQPFKNDGNQLPESSPTAGAEAQQKSSPLCSVKQGNVATLQIMSPMWSAFIVFGLVMSTASTFFIMQYDNMDADRITTSSFLLAKDVLKEVVAYLCKLLVSSLNSKSQQNLALKMIICLGIMFSVLCPSFAWQVEVQRLKIAHERELLGMSEDTKMLMSASWLAPQFCLWGLAEGLAISGLDEFFSYHVPKSMEDYGSEVFNTIPSVIGSFLSVVCVSACGGWFGNTLNQSRLDNYYRMITVVAWINLCWFFFVSTFYSTKEEVADEGIQLQEEVNLDISELLQSIFIS